MAKQTALQLLNKVLNNLGESPVSSGTLNAISGLSLLVFNTINEVIHELSLEKEGKLKPLEADGTLTMTQNVGTYAQPTDMRTFDKDSFRYNQSKELIYVTPQKWDRDFKTQTSTGEPSIITLWKSYFRPYYIPHAAADAKTVNYRYWSIATLLNTDTETATCFIPEGFDITLLCDMVTYKILAYKHNSEALTYYAKVYGDGRTLEGSLARFTSLYSSPDIIDGNIVVEPMESRGRRNFIQPPITS